MEAEAAEQGLSRAESFSRDLLRRFGSLDDRPEAGAGGGGGGGGLVSDEIELSLGLSLGGSFRPADSTKLGRSSSIAAILTAREQHDFPAVPSAPLARTCSLPAETEEEQRKRKEMQCLKRLEAKRKRSERRSSRCGRRDDGGGEGGLATLAAAAGKVVKFEIEIGGSSSKQQPPNGAAPPPWGRPPASQGSMGSQCSSSSVLTEFDSRSNQGFDVSGFGTETKGLLSVQSLPGRTSYKPSSSAAAAAEVGTALPMALARGSGGSGGGVGKEAAGSLRRNSAGDMGRAMMEEMPCVSTRGEGPNGQRIEGFLYKYRKGEEVRIVCVCHGRFLTPAEFVKHAGGGDVAHPLRHIVVNPSPSAYLS